MLHNKFLYIVMSFLMNIFFLVSLIWLFLVSYRSRYLIPFFVKIHTTHHCIPLFLMIFQLILCQIFSIRILIHLLCQTPLMILYLLIVHLFILLNHLLILLFHNEFLYGVKYSHPGWRTTYYLPFRLHQKLIQFFYNVPLIIKNIVTYIICLLQRFLFVLLVILHWAPYL